MTSQNSKAMAIAVVAGILLLIAGVNGVVAWKTVKEFVTTHVMDNYAVQVLFVVLIAIASLGGLAVIAGGLLIGRDKVGTGKFLIALGVGMGLIGLIISCYIAYKEKSLTVGSFLSVGALGIILSIVARIMSKKE